MRRREFIAGLGGGAAWPLLSASGAAQTEAIKRLGYAAMSTPQAHLDTTWTRGFHAALKTYGWQPGRNLHIEYHFANDDPGRAETIARELVATRPDVIFVASRPLLPSVARATSTIPVVFNSLGDAIAEGWVKSLSDPGRNLTGVAGLSPDLAGKRLELLREFVPALTTVGILWNTSNKGEEIAALAIRDAAQSLGIRAALEPTKGLKDIDRALAVLVNGGAEGLVVLPDPSFLADRARIVDVVRQTGLPAIYTESPFVRAGGLMSYSASLDDLYRGAATYVDKLLRGARPADLPVEQATRFEFTLNLSTARAMGLTVPDTAIARADEVIE